MTWAAPPNRPPRLPWFLGLAAVALMLCAADAPNVEWTIGLGASGIAVALAQIGVAYWQYRSIHVKAIHDEDAARDLARVEAERDDARRDANHWRIRAERAEFELSRIRSGDSGRQG